LVDKASWKARYPDAKFVEQLQARFPCQYAPAVGQPRLLDANEGYKGILPPDQTGILTVKGVKQLHAVGKRLRERFVHQHGLLGGTNALKEVDVSSTFIQRTIQSTQSLLTGLCGDDDAMGTAGAPQGQQLITVSEDWGRMVPDLDVCSRQEELERAFWQTARVREIEEFYTPIRQRLSRALIEENIVGVEVLEGSTAASVVRDFDYVPCTPAALSWKQGGDFTRPCHILATLRHSLPHLYNPLLPSPAPLLPPPLLSAPQSPM
jgi:hypothetical protein